MSKGMGGSIAARAGLVNPATFRRMPSLLGTLTEAFDAAGIDLSRLGLAWARVSPTVTIVPAFGLRALPAPARAVMGLALAAVIVPAVPPLAAEGAGSWLLRALEQMALGLPVAVAAAVPLWAATMAGGVADALRNANDQRTVAVVEGPATPLGVPLSLLASAIFLATGGPARVLEALATRPIGVHPLLAAANDVTQGIALAVAIGGPLLAAAVVIEVGAALVARAASPAQVHLLLAPLRALAVLAVMGIVLERVGAVLAVAVEGAPHT
jgi:type III secretory pathway component EscT